MKRMFGYSLVIVSFALLTFFAVGCGEQTNEPLTTEQQVLLAPIAPELAADNMTYTLKFQKYTLAYETEYTFELTGNDLAGNPLKNGGRNYAFTTMSEGSSIGGLTPIMITSGVEPAGNVAIGTVGGDLHDIGKNLVVMMLKNAGFEVIDLGIDVAPEKFAEAVKQDVSIIAIVTSTTTDMATLEATFKAIRQENPEVSIMLFYIMSDIEAFSKEP